MKASVAIEASPAQAAALRQMLDGSLDLSGRGAGAPDCVIMVHEPPSVDALALLARMQNPSGVPSTAVVVVSRGMDAGLRRAALRAGAMEVAELHGPAPEALSCAVEEAIGRFSVIRRSARGRAGFEHAAAGGAGSSSSYGNFGTGTRSGERFAQRVIDNLFAFVGVLDESGTLLDANQAPLSAAGIGIDDVRGKKFWDCYWWSYSDAVSERLRSACECAAGGEVVRYDAVVRMAGDSRMAIDFQVSPLRDDAGRVTHLIPSAIDITERKRAEAALVESERREIRRLKIAQDEVRRATELLQAVTDTVPDPIYAKDRAGRVLLANAAALRAIGKPIEQVLGHDEHEWLGDTPQAWVIAANDRRIMETGQTEAVEEPLSTREGERIFLSAKTPLRSAAGDVIGLVGVSRDMTEQKRVEQALRDADRRKDEFIAILAHELRNPLSPIRTAVHLLGRIGFADPRLERARDIIDRQVTHMARLIDDLLDVSRIARGKLALQMETCDLAAIARQVAEDYRTSFEAAGLSLDASGSLEPVWVEGDPVRLAQMVGNLLHNAVRFTEQGGCVRVRTERDATNRVALVSVTDTGVGIDPALLSRLFDPFSQADQDLARSKGGLGLGLTLTKGLAELHGGGVAAQSDGAGRGATFTLRIPSSKARYEEAASEHGAGAAAQPGLRILVVEDNRDAAEMLGDLLALDGHRIELAFDGATAVERARVFEPDVVISDLGLPGALDGYAVARALRTDAKFDRVYLIALSGYANEDARRRSREAGFDAHVAKPPDIAALERALSEFASAQSLASASRS